MTEASAPVDAETYQRTKAGQREVVGAAQSLHPDARRLLTHVTGHTPLYLPGVHNTVAVAFDHVAALVELGLIEPVAP